MDRGQNFNIEAPLQYSSVFNVTKGQLITF